MADRNLHRLALDSQCRQSTLQQGFQQTVAATEVIVQYALANAGRGIDIAQGNDVDAFGRKQSLGGIESLIVHPASMTHAAMSAEALATAGISDGLIRLSIGLEEAPDLIAALERGLAQIA